MSDSKRLASYYGLPIGFVGAALGSLLVNGITYLVVDPVFRDNYTTPLLLLYAAVFSMFAGITEEIIYRGSLLALCKYKQWRLSWVTALIFMQAVVFTVAHYKQHRNPVFYIAVFAVGLLLGIAVVRLRSLWLAVGIHAGLDFVSLSINGVVIAGIMNYPGILSFDAAGNAFKIAMASALPIAALGWLAWQTLALRRTATKVAMQSLKR